MTPKTFEAYLLSTEDPLGISGLNVGGGHVTKVKDRTSSRFVPLSHRAGVGKFDRGVSAIGARYLLSDQAMVGASIALGLRGFSYDFANLGIDGLSTFAIFVHGEAQARQIRTSGT